MESSKDKQIRHTGKKNARWIVSYECSNCGEIRSHPFDECPFCKADMREWKRKNGIELGICPESVSKSAKEVKNEIQ